MGGWRKPEEGFATVEAPSHGHGLRLLHQRHFIYLPVAGRASHALRHVDRVVEINVVGQRMDPIPCDRLSHGEAVVSAVMTAIPEVVREREGRHSSRLHRLEAEAARTAR